MARTKNVGKSTGAKPRVARTIVAKRRPGARPVPDLAAEWLETDGLGGFASGTVGGARTRRYHALLLAATRPPAGRVVLVNGCEMGLETASRTFPLSSERYAPDVTHPDVTSHLVSFLFTPWPLWKYRFPDGTEIEHERFVPHGAPAVVLRWRLVRRGDTGVARLKARPFLSGRDLHALHHENPVARFVAERAGQGVRWQLYESVPAVTAWSNGDYRDDPLWYRNFQCDEERARGLDFVEDLAAPGVFSFDLTRGEAVCMLAAHDVPAAGSGILPGWVPPHVTAAAPPVPIVTHVRELASRERLRRSRFATRLEFSADQYLVARGTGRTVIAGYPWFGDWGRDTFIALRGLCLATGRLEEAGHILLEWAGAVSEGMLPNRFPDQGDVPEYNAVDASLWYVIAVDEWCNAMAAAKRHIPDATRRTLEVAVDAILEGYARGTRYRIRMDDDGLIAAGVPGVQLTWMDAKIGDWVVTPRIGKPVEVQALWLAALRTAAGRSKRWAELLERGSRSFSERFWNEDGGYLYDVVDVDHVRGTVDATFRPNQIFAVGGLPVSLLDDERAARVVSEFETRLWTPLGPRSLDPAAAGYRPRYEGGVLERDSSYHQGTVWPWLAGAFVDAWLRVHGDGAAEKRQARERFVVPLVQHLEEAGLGHVSEIADADAPHTPRGCPFQAWSVGELIRALRLVGGSRRVAGAGSAREPEAASV